ncbi:hypothetical protein [Priestia aryabhattai]|uniref:hypothetical protein n=1 Tax=Priestia aryabhattai TaxID=412384 RepID=UPI003557BDCE
MGPYETKELMGGEVKGSHFYFYAQDDLGTEWPDPSGGRQPRYHYIEEWSDPSDGQPRSLYIVDKKLYWTHVPSRQFFECWNVADGRLVAMRHIKARSNNHSVSILY